MAFTSSVSVMGRPKHQRLVSKAITQSARGEECTIRSHKCNRNSETTVFCHLPSLDKGTGYKSPDYWGVYGCSNCHARLDANRMSSAEMIDLYARAYYLTLSRLIDKGLVEFK